MKKILFLSLVTLLTCTSASQKVVADERWSTEEYDVVYQEDRNRTAIWTYGSVGTIFIDGLAGVYTDRGSYTGYWVQETSSLRCDTYREGADGKPTYHWGRFEIAFIDPDFPSRWQANIGLCDREPTIRLNGVPMTP
ncbi:hypothetical protein KR51_00016020 [Rubidibacter lacunae KORDI 51-2]|uniref:Uncharacterized protein n=1 Tax=Rubidibacter lacunae KORDI 51-2 TaxID=582515 RepID=U5DMD4_9CHRO|nr:hypothetical protein [Rubidibacter lacunae]ERN41754.1 hypothetical protein KR51_00016020 [Rubidibacter lacunae KORDI 51-2]